MRARNPGQPGLPGLRDLPGQPGGSRLEVVRVGPVRVAAKISRFFSFPGVLWTSCEAPAARLKRPRFEKMSREPKSGARFTSTITTYIEQVSNNESVIHHVSRTSGYYNLKMETVRTPDPSCAV